MPPDVSVSVIAYCKLVLHLSKYPHCAVNGVLLAKKPTKENRSLHFVDVIPLFHLALELTPMLEVAMTQIESYCSQQGLIIAGYYHAGAVIGDPSPTFIAKRIADKICENFSDGCLFMVNNNKLKQLEESEIYRIYCRHDGKWEIKDQKVTVEEDGMPIASALVDAQVYDQLVDFDNHLDNITLDWKNTFVQEHIERVVPQ